MNKLIQFSFCFGLWVLMSQPIAGQNLTLLPQPQSITVEKGFYSTGSSEITISYPSIVGEKTNARKQLGDLFAERGVKWKKKGKATIIFSLQQPNDQGVPNHAEGYSLTINTEGIRVKAQSESGFFYAVQTLKQIFDRKVNEKIPYCTILDYPTLDNRGLMDDISRGPLPTLEFAKEQIRVLSSMKYNLFTFYIEHVVKTKQHGSFAPSEGWTIEEIEGLSTYAKEYNMQLAGSFQSLGHFDKILEFPQYRSLGSTSRMLKPGDTASLLFMKDIIKELAPAFGGSVFNLNGDEAWDLERAAKNHPEGLTAGQLYLRHMQPLLKDLIATDVRPLMWGDILMNHPEIIEEIPEETIILTWDYSDRESFAAWIDPFQHSKLDFWVCPGVLNSNRFYPNFNDAFGNILGFVGEGLDKKTAGMLLTVWDDGGRHFFNRDWPGVAFGAEQSWNYSFDHEASFMDRFSTVFFGDTKGVFVEFIEKMLSLKDSPVMLNMNNGSFQKDIFPDRDQELSFSSKNWQKVLKTVIEAREIIDELNSLHSEGNDPLLFWRFTLDQLELIAKSRIKMIELSDTYRGVSVMQLSFPDNVKAQLSSTANELEDLKAGWEQLFENFKRLWLLENRSYWVEQANEPYEEHLLDLTTLQKRLTKVVEAFDPVKGIYLPSPSKVGFTVSDISSAYFNYWLVTGPFKIIDYEKDTKMDYLQAMGGEQNARPIPGTLFEGSDGKQMMWDKIASAYDDRLVLAELFQEKTKAVAYAYCQIKTPKAMNVTAAFGSNDGIAVYLNGDEVFREHIKRNMLKGENSVSLTLQQGTNHVLVKTDQWKGRWEFSFNLEGVEWTSHKHKYTLIP